MIFVTVGTHEQPFNRLIKKVDELVGDGSITEDVFMQTGYSTYEPKNCGWTSFLSHDEMNNYMNTSDIIISHGGPATFMYALSLGKKAIVVPRLEKFHEHVNNHQLTFSVAVKKRGYGIKIVKNINDLLDAIYLKKSDDLNVVSHNDKFNDSLIKIIKDMVKIK